MGISVGIGVGSNSGEDHFFSNQVVPENYVLEFDFEREPGSKRIEFYLVVNRRKLFLKLHGAKESGKQSGLGLIDLKGPNGNQTGRKIAPPTGAKLERLVCFVPPELVRANLNGAPFVEWKESLSWLHNVK